MIVLTIILLLSFCAKESVCKIMLAVVSIPKCGTRTISKTLSLLNFKPVHVGSGGGTGFFMQPDPEYDVNPNGTTNKAE